MFFKYMEGNTSPSLEDPANLVTNKSKNQNLNKLSIDSRFHLPKKLNQHKL